MRTPLVLLNIAHDRTRALLGVVAVAFAVVLMFMQIGFYKTAETSAHLILGSLDFDILLRSPHYLHLVEAHGFPADCLTRSESVQGVAGVSSLRIGTNQWNNLSDREYPRAILVIGFDPLQPVFTLDEVERNRHLLTGGRSLLVDRTSRSEFGPVNRKAFGDGDLGRELELGGARMRIAGHFEMGTGFAADGAVLVSEQGYRRLQLLAPPDEVTLGLVRLEEGADRNAVLREIRGILGDEVEVLDRTTALESESRYWLWQTPIGLIFFVGVVLGMVIGSVLLYLVLANDVMKRLSEYATLKAMGYRDSFLTGVVLQQAVILAIMGFVPGWLGAVALYSLAEKSTNLDMTMSYASVLSVLGLTLTMCALSGFGALHKLRSAEPAKLF